MPRMMLPLKGEGSSNRMGSKSTVRSICSNRSKRTENTYEQHAALREPVGKAMTRAGRRDQLNCKKGSEGDIPH